MGVKNILQIIGAISFNQPWLMTILFMLFYLALGLAALTTPIAAVVMYFGTTIMNPQTSYPLLSDLPMAKIAAGVCLAACLLNMGKLTFRLPLMLLPMIAFLIMANISALNAIFPALADQRFEEFNKIGLMVFLTIWAMRDRKAYDFLFWGILASFGYCVLKNLVETQTLGSWVSIKGVAGWISDSNDWALALTMALPLFYTALAYNWQRGWKVRLLLGGALAGALLTLTLTSSRGGFLAAAGSGLLFLAMDRKPWRAVMVAGAAALVVSFYMPDSYVDKIQSIFGLEDAAQAAWNKELEDSEEYTGAERLYFWRVASEIMADHPLTGVGWGNFIKEFERREDTPDVAVAHSTWFQVGAEAGEIGLALYALMIVTALLQAFRSWWKARKADDLWREMHSRSVFCGLVAFCIGATFLSRENSEFVFLYLAMASSLTFLPMVPTPALAPAQAQAQAPAQEPQGGIGQSEVAGR